jgi:hypothetical protein
MATILPLAMNQELREIEAKLSISNDPKQIEFFKKIESDAEARLAAIDKTNLNDYSMALQQFILAKQRASATYNRNELLAQKIAILENILASMQ